MSIKFKALFLATAMLAPLMAAPSAAQDTTAEWTWSEPSVVFTDPWQFDANVYGWLPSAPIKIRTAGTEERLSEPFGTILDSLEMAAMSEFEVHKGPFGAFVGPVFYRGKYTEHFTGPLGGRDKGKIKEKAWIIDYGLTYDLGTMRLGNKPNSPTVTVAPLVGGLFLHDKLKVNIGTKLNGPGLKLRKTIEFNTPIVGLNTFWQFTDNWVARLEGYVGGFTVDDVTKTYEVLVAGGYHFNIGDQRAKVFAGYRYTYIHYDDGGLSFKLKVKGPLVGFGLEF